MIFFKLTSLLPSLSLLQSLSLSLIFIKESYQRPGATQQPLPFAPKSPFTDAGTCNANGIAPVVDGFPGTPYKVIPFTETFSNPPLAQAKDTVCRSDGHCIKSFDINVVSAQKRPFDKTIPSCKNFPPTWFLTYNGSVPGPTIKMPTGHESIIRFKNSINTVNGFFKESFDPCLPNNGRSGRPFSVHNHGSASLAPYDGWAEDETCFNEVKDYVYPNNRPNTGWYHDHALHITADNAYYGLAGFYIISDKKKDGGCGELWNLEDIPEWHMILSDKVLDNKCQLFADPLDIHRDDLYGDVNLVSGIPFPVMNLEPKWNRFRILNAAVSRPYLLKIKDNNMNDISQKLCKIIATDGGYVNTPVNYPVEGLLIGVAERYEIVCDFSNLKSQTLYFWNDRDTKIMKGVPYFCNSHLISKIVIKPTVSKILAIFNPSLNLYEPVKPIEKTLSASDIQTAISMANAGRAHREFHFGRNNGHWTINGETWDTNKIAASDIGQNTWELWRISTGGGWFHPIHVHLIDFFLVKRENPISPLSIASNGLRTNEFLSSKDVFYLAPGDTDYVIARFGPHKGDYMFHCHNLIHEDDDMMRAFRVTNSSGGINAGSAKPFVVNKLNGIIYNNWKYSDPMLGDTNAKPVSKAKAFNRNLVSETLALNLYRIFYPLASDIKLMGGVFNPWQSRWCPLR